MIVNNGTRRALTIAGVFEGLCGESNGTLSFIPNQTGRDPLAARGGLLDGEPVLLEVKSGAHHPFFNATYRSLS